MEVTKDQWSMMAWLGSEALHAAQEQADSNGTGFKPHWYWWATTQERPEQRGSHKFDTRYLSGWWKVFEPADADGQEAYDDIAAAYAVTWPLPVAAPSPQRMLQWQEQALCEWVGYHPDDRAAYLPMSWVRQKVLQVHIEIAPEPSQFVYGGACEI